MEALFERCQQEGAACFRQGKPPVMHASDWVRLHLRPLDRSGAQGRQLSSAAIVSSALVLVMAMVQLRRWLHGRGPSSRGPRCLAQLLGRCGQVPAPGDGEVPHLGFAGPGVWSWQRRGEAVEEFLTSASATEGWHLLLLDKNLGGHLGPRG